MSDIRVRSSSFNIPELTSDPASPAQETAWVLNTTSGGAGGGELKAFLGLSFPILSPGTGGSSTYQLSYRTIAGTTKELHFHRKGVILATGSILIDEGATTHLPTYTFSEDAVTKEVGRSVLNNSSGTEVGTSAAPLEVNLRSSTVGVATSAKQDTIIGHVDGIEGLLTTIDADTGSIATTNTSIDGKITACNTGAVVLSSGTVTTVSTVTNLSQMSGAAIAMGTGVRSAGTQRVTIATDDVVPASQSGTWNVTNVSGTVSLPTGASTAANQTTIIGHVDGIETVLGTIDADTGNISTKIDTIAGAVSGTEIQVDVLTMPTVTVDSELPTAAALADNTANPTTTSVGTFSHWYDGSTWDRAKGDATDGLLVNLGSNNDVTVTGSVTANAGTNLNTSALALESGGNLAAIATSASVLDDWDESDRAKVNIIVGQAGIAAGVGATGATVPRVVIANDQGKTLLSAGGSASSSGNNTLVAAGTNKLKVYAFSLTTTSTTAMTCIFQSGAGGTELWRCVLQAPTSVSTGANLAISPPAYLFATAAATLLNLNLSSANAVHWSVSYFDES